jgi:hypothetical protein
MAYYLVKAEFKMEDGTVLKHSGWYEGEDYIQAAEAARCDRQWDLRPHMREGEFTHPEQVVSASFSAKRYNVLSLVDAALPGASEEDINRLDPDWRDVQEAGYGFER